MDVKSRAWSLLIAVLALAGDVAALPPPGSPERLTDWRWLARPPEGQRSTLTGKQALEAREGKFLLLEVSGAGVLDHLILRDPELGLAILVDGRPLWEGKLSAPAQPPAGTPAFFPAPLLAVGASFHHLLAPIGFKTSLRLLVDKPDPWRYLSYRTFDNAAAILPAVADPASDYVAGLQAAAAAWQAPAEAFHAKPAPAEREEAGRVKVEAGSRATALNLTGSGEMTHLEFHLIPALIGSLRELVVECFYDGARDPALRLPITDLVGLPHPWTGGRWDTISGTPAAGLRVPWPEHTQPAGVVNHRHATFYFNLPIPFANGLRIELVNRSARRAFWVGVRAVVAPAPDAATAGRLCGTRVIAPVAAGGAPFVTLPGAGQIVALSLFCTGSELFPPAQLNGAAWLKADDAPPVTGPGLVPLWVGGGYGGPYSLAVWNHPRLEPGFVGVTRHFLTDPLPFTRQAAFGYDPGKNLAGAPTQATAVVLWYCFDAAPYAAPALPPRAEALPYTTLYKPDWYVPVKGAQLAATIEAEDLAPMATAHGGEARADEDPDHNYHASGGRYLVIRTDHIGGYVDCRLPFPRSRYFVIGQAYLSTQMDGMTHTCFELSLLSREQARHPPPEVSAADRFAWSVLGGAKMNLQVFSLNALSYRRDPVHFYPPQLNPARDADGVFRFICRGPGIRMLCFDQFWLYQPPATAEGWYEFEDAALPETSGGLTASLPLTGRLEWSGWGALRLDAQTAGKATLTTLVLTGPAATPALRLTGSLAPGAGQWQARLAGGAAPAVTLTPGTNASQTAEWSLPAAGLGWPGPLTLDIEYLPPEDADPKPPGGVLHLDAWSILP